MTKSQTNFKYLLIVIMAFLVAGGILIYQSWWLPKREAKLPETKLPQKVLPIGETADWQTYTNDQYGFSFKYPQNWSVGEEGDIKQSVNVYVESTEKNSLPAMNVYISKTDLDLDQIVKDKEEQHLFIKESNIILDNLLAYEGMGSGITGFYSIIVKKDQYGYELAFLTPSEDKTTMSHEQELILSTFRFIK